ncbi:MAG: hypothetical protein A3J83_00860 [Elusimicrobia bacterium RIFOXYA2_FULL_40_6]|nr:MAG: hypothetical protein A3J83_00860 [Elusimicrobia bacterium RIFOXYA2_FULL_40_6]
MDRDHLLIERFVKGDAQAFDALIHEHSPKAYGLIFSFVYNRQDAQDLSQELWLIVYRSLKSFRFHSSFYTWLYRIAVNLCIRFLKRKKTALLPDDFDTVELNHTKVIESKETLREIYGAVNKLPDKQRAVFILRNYQDLPYEEISRIVNISVSSAKTNYCYAVRKLQNLVSKDVLL